MRLVFENGGRTGMRDVDAASAGIPLWTEQTGALYAELGPQNSAWWFDKTTPQPTLLRRGEDMAVEIERWRAAGKQYDLGAQLWAEAEALALDIGPGQATGAIRL
jgi:phage terminase large subunit GpA-like protein